MKENSTYNFIKVKDAIILDKFLNKAIREDVEVISKGENWAEFYSEYSWEDRVELYANDIFADAFYVFMLTDDRGLIISGGYYSQDYNYYINNEKEHLEESLYTNNKRKLWNIREEIELSKV